MQLHRRLLTLAGVVVVLAFGASNSFAGELEFIDVDFTITWAGFSFSPDGGEVISCPVTLRGRMHEQVIGKVYKSLIGNITHVTVNDERCIGGRADELAETLPWPVLFDSFSGTLPHIDGVSVLILRASFQARRESSYCLAESTAQEPWKGTFNLHPLLGSVQQFTNDASLIDTRDTTGSLCDLGAVDTELLGVGRVNTGDGFAFVIDLV